ncbi:hypothetical protein L6452_34871 [Arctium lappa]|uniref:Uncharacterized protein n=1 Tax=Arctium lappa TaxID=4217 RepID=A0ACB8YKL5_ARCLA|nr:hypothetical protein L6452_34871 [Arctium lappa]
MYLLLLFMIKVFEWCSFLKATLDRRLILNLCFSLNDEGFYLLRSRDRVANDLFGVLSNWNDDLGGANPCSWFGVNRSKGCVVASLRDNNELLDSISPEVQQLTLLPEAEQISYKNRRAITGIVADIRRDFHMEIKEDKDLRWFNVESVPEDYIFSKEKRPRNLDIPVCDLIPVIDLAKVAASNGRTQSIEAVLTASQEFGLFQVINHGIIEKTLNNVMSVVKEFFDMPSKDRTGIVPHMKNWIYTNNTDYAKDGVYLWRENLKHPCNSTGRQVLKDGEWINVGAVPNAFVAKRNLKMFSVKTSLIDTEYNITGLSEKPCNEQLPNGPGESTVMRALSKLIYVKSPNLVLFIENDAEINYQRSIRYTTKYH